MIADRRPRIGPLRRIALAAALLGAAAAHTVGFAAAGDIRLGDAPYRIESQDTSGWAAWPLGTPSEMADAAQARANVVQLYKTVYVPGGSVALTWTGDIATCVPGTTNAAHQQAVIDRINYARTLTGLPGVALLGNPEATRAQAASLIMSANNALSHSPPTNWQCYSTDGATGAGSSNLALGAFGVDSIDLYLDDPGSGNWAAGHRRWVLFPPRAAMATGDVPGSGTTHGPANALYVFGPTTTRPATPSGIAWPPAGFVPYQNLPVLSNRWSLAYPGADFSGATVTMTGPAGAISVTLESLAIGYGDNTIVFRPSGVSYEKPAVDTTYTIGISGIKGAGIPPSIDYTVTVIDPDAPAPKVDQAPLAVSATPPSLLYGGTATLSTSGGSGTGAVSYTVTIGPCSVVGSTLTAIGVGPCTVSATKAGDSTYNDVSATVVVAIGKASQTIVFGAAPSLGVGGSGVVSATATSGLAVSFSSLTPGVCTVAGATVRGLGAGTCTIAADQAGNANYNPAPQVSLSFGVASVTVMQPLLVTSSGLGVGTVTSDSPGIACGANCSAFYAAGSSVTLIATPTAGSAFLLWSGACSGRGICAIFMNTARQATATFGRVNAASDYANEYVQKAYVAYYGRPADPAGLAYWATRMDNEGGSLASIIGAFGNSDEFNRRYGGMSYTDLVARIYAQTLGRDPDPAGLAWYVGELQAGRRTLQSITLDVLNGATGIDVDTVANRLDVANHYTGKVATGCPYGGEPTGVASLAGVTPDSATAWSAKMSIESRCGP